MPAQGVIRVEAPNEANGNHRAVVDLRTAYMRRMREIYNRLMFEALQEHELQTLLDRALDYSTRIIKFVEDCEDSGTLPPEELAANQALWEEATELADRIKVDVNTKLAYYNAGVQPNARDVREQERLEKIRRLQAKMQPFGGHLEQ